MSCFKFLGPSIFNSSPHKVPVCFLLHCHIMSSGWSFAQVFSAQHSKVQVVALHLKKLLICLCFHYIRCCQWPFETVARILYLTHPGFAEQKPVCTLLCTSAVMSVSPLQTLPWSFCLFPCLTCVLPCFSKSKIEHSFRMSANRCTLKICSNLLETITWLEELRCGEQTIQGQLWRKERLLQHQWGSEEKHAQSLWPVVYFGIGRSRRMEYLFKDLA